MSKLEALCEEYLTTTGATLWGRSWTVLEETSRKQAAAWLAEQLRGVMDLERTKK